MHNSSEILLHTAINAALKAGMEILHIYKGNFKVDLKMDDTPLTDADRRSNEIIFDALGTTGIPLLSEESDLPDYNTRKKWEYLWVVDPLDGTKEFISRNGEFTVNIALIRNGSPVLGVVYTPVPDELYFALDAYGSYKCIPASLIKSEMSLQEMVSISKKLPIARGKEIYTVVASRSHMNQETQDFIDKIKKENGEIRIVSRGSSLKLCMVAEGVADIYPRFGRTMEWDIASGHAIVLNTGKNVRNAANSQPLQYNKEDLSNPYFIAS